MYNTTVKSHMPILEVRGFNKSQEKDDGTSWGIFTNEACARIMWETISKKFGTKTQSFYIKEMVGSKPKLTGIMGRFREAQVEEMDSQY